ncbi:MAG: hypothetical protein KDC80_09545 [Saprospiraceae bacterium]|nr:hypothetical protein [Saprospiraceae bacterium]
MSEILALVLANIILLYFGTGVVFSLYFVLKGAAKLDPLIAQSKWTVKLLLIPGAIATWPILWRKTQIK